MFDDNFPVVKPQPNLERYGINDLALFHKHSREELENAGFVVPPFNSALRPKYWMDESVDLSDPEADKPYLVIQVKNEVPVETIIHMPAREAASLNIPNKGQTASRPEWEVPIRELESNERLTVYGAYGVQIIRTDFEEQKRLNSGDFLPEDRAKLDEILAAVRRLLAQGY